MPISLETFASRNQSTQDDGVQVMSVPHAEDVLGEVVGPRNQSILDDGVHVVRVPDVADVLGEVIRQQYVVLQCRINESSS